MKHTDIVIIGAGQAGLAMSRCLSARGIAHIVLERGRIGERWRSERWESLRLLTPNWMTRLPGGGYDGPDPDGFMTMPETVRFLEGYAHSIAAPVESGVAVKSVKRSGDGYRVVTDAGEWMARGLVIATGHCDQPRIPLMASRLGRRILQVVPRDYRRPGQLPEGGVLVIGASASGIQLAEEIHASGRPVTLSIGHHTRLPRRYRGHDILWWLDRLGSLRKARTEVHPHDTQREEPSLQLIGSPDHRSIDLALLQRKGVRLVGRATAARGRRLRFAADLLQTTAAAICASCAFSTASTRRRSRVSARLPHARRPSQSSCPGAQLNWTSIARASERWCGPRATGAAIPGSTFRFSMPVARSSTTAASVRSRASTSSDSTSCAGATRASSTA